MKDEKFKSIGFVNKKAFQKISILLALACKF